MRELSLKDVLCMEGQKVIIHDLAYDIYDQECIIKFERNSNGKVFKIFFVNEEYVYKMDFLGRKENGDFQIFTKEKNYES